MSQFVVKTPLVQSLQSPSKTSTAHLLFLNIGIDIDHILRVVFVMFIFYYVYFLTQVLDIEDDEFDQADSNDIHMNRSREIVHIMSKISSNCEKRETTNCCSKLLDIFSIHPDIKDHLVTHFGVTPILEMFDATQTCHQAVRE